MNQKLLKLTAFLLVLTCIASSCQPEEIEYTILPTSLNFDATGGEAEFTVSVKSPAIVESVESLAEWCQVSKNGVSPVIVTVSPNTNYFDPRNTTVVVNMKLGETKTSVAVQITQEKAEIPEWVLIAGIKWATRNVDMPGTFAAKPEDAGMFYQWNRKVGWSATDPMINSDGGTTWDGSYPFGDTWEKVNDPCPQSWRVPTMDELESLAVSGSQWTTLNGVDGRIFGSDDAFLFLPAAGYRMSHSYNVLDGLLSTAGVIGHYWGSNGVSTFCMIFHSDNVYPLYNIRRANGLSVRCVAE